MTVTPRAGAVVLALGATLGVGVFTGLAPAAALAGPWFLFALLLAALTALCCAFSTADQHRAYPDAPGGYAYIRNQLGPWPARIGAAAHLIGRAGVAAALAGTFGAYVFPADRTLAGLALLIGTAALGRHVRGRVGWAVAAVVVGVLALVALVGFSVAPPDNAAAPAAGFDGIMGAASILLIAFTGFERVTAPHPNEPTFPAKTLHVAIPVLIGVALMITAVVGFALLRQLGAPRLALSPAPLRDALVAADGTAVIPLLTFGAAVAAVASLSWVLGSARRTLTGLTETGDLPPIRSGWPLDVIGTALAAAAFLLLPTTTALAVGACATAFYYGFTNAGARVLLHEDRTWSMRTACIGLGMSVLLAMSAPAEALVITVVGIALGTGLLALGRLRQPVG
ncbi:amino acid permease [Saccharothrix sp.]|uniref:amino acid permease n=1 Tax=Saccharothrix sp. TaxID=1873460 RepID=UPI002810FA71|nr:amino acid permease [Saccharothrix sp.]